MGDDINKQLQNCRNELKNIRDNMFKIKKRFQKDVEEIKSLIISNSMLPNVTPTARTSEYKLHPIGYVESCFQTKNGTPRQPTVCPQSKARLRILKSTFNNPEHSLLGLEEYSHIWLLFIFHKNDSTKQFSKAKVRPPRLNGKTVGIFSTRSPHRPNSLGLTLTYLEKIEGNTLHLMGVDLVNGTPVVDIKPYIPTYDTPQITDGQSEILPNCSNIKDGLHSSYSDLSNTETSHISRKIICNDDDCNTNLFTTELINIASWLSSPPVNELNVHFSPRAENALKKFHKKTIHNIECEFCLEFLQDTEQVKQLISQLLQGDPRSIYRRKRCSDRLYYFTVDNLHVTAWFENEFETEVLRIVPKTSVEFVSGNSNTDS